jgi:hypothetical protein
MYSLLKQTRLKVNGGIRQCHGTSILTEWCSSVVFEPHVVRYEYLRYFSVIECIIVVVVVVVVKLLIVCYISFFPLLI